MSEDQTVEVVAEKPAPKAKAKAAPKVEMEVSPIEVLSMGFGEPGVYRLPDGTVAETH